MQSQRQLSARAELGRFVQEGWLGLLLVALGAWALIGAWGAGTAARNDSSHYLFTARALSDGLGLIRQLPSWGQEPNRLVEFAPGFPVAIWLGTWFGIGVKESAQWVIGSCYVGTLSFLYLLLTRALPARQWPVAVLLTLLFGSSPEVLNEATFVMSSFLLAVTTLACCWCLLRCLERPSLSNRLGFALALAALLLSRWASLFAVAGLLVSGFVLWNGSLRRLLSTMGWPTALGFAPWFACAGMNWLAEGTAFGRRSRAFDSLEAVMEQAATGWFAWVSGSAQGFASRPVRWAFEAGFVLCAALVLLSMLLRLVDAKRPAVLVPALVGGTYTLALILSKTLLSFDKLSISRFWLVTWPLFVWFAVGVLGQLWSRSDRLRWALLLPVVTMALLSVSHAQAFLAHHAESRPPWLYARSARDAARYFASQKDCERLASDLRPISVHLNLYDVHRLPRPTQIPKLARGKRRFCLAIRSWGKRKTMKESHRLFKEHMHLKQLKKYSDYTFYVATPKR